MRNRLKVFEALNRPVIDYYAKNGKLYRVTIFSFNAQLDLGELAFFRDLHHDNLHTRIELVSVYHF